MQCVILNEVSNQGMHAVCVILNEVADQGMHAVCQFNDKIFL